jgi:DNA processing protein
VTDEFSKGCNKLIAANKAGILCNAAELEASLGWASAMPRMIMQKKLLPELTEDEMTVIGLLKETPAAVDFLSFNTQFNMSKLAAVMLQLEINGIVRQLPGKIYELV